MSTSDISKSPKKDTHRLLQNLPDDASWEDIEYAIYVVKRIRAGEEEIRNGDVMTSEIARKKLKKWLK